jgi:hypothetical protein
MTAMNEGKTPANTSFSHPGPIGLGVWSVVYSFGRIFDGVSR